MILDDQVSDKQSIAKARGMGNSRLRFKRRKNFDGCPRAIRNVPVPLMVIGWRVVSAMSRVVPNRRVSHFRVDDV